MLENFIYAKQKSLFEKALNNGEVLDEAIVFIEDTKEIWNHGTYFDGSTFDPSNIEASIQNITDNYVTTDTEQVINGKKIIQDTSFRVQSTSRNACIVTAHGGDYSAVQLQNISSTNGNTPSLYQLSNTTGGSIVMMAARSDNSKPSGDINLLTKDYETQISPKLGLFNREDYPYKCAIIGVQQGQVVRSALPTLATGVDLQGGHVLITPVCESFTDNPSAHFEWDKDTHILKIDEFYPNDNTTRDIADVQINGYSIMTTKWSKLILSSFTLEGVSYNFEEGMTWEDWVNSDYNTGNFEIDLSNFVYTGSDQFYVAGNNVFIYKRELINSKIEYNKAYRGSLGGSDD